MYLTECITYPFTLTITPNPNPSYPDLKLNSILNPNLKTKSYPAKSPFFLWEPAKILFASQIRPHIASRMQISRPSIHTHTHFLEAWSLTGKLLWTWSPWTCRPNTSLGSEQMAVNTQQKSFASNLALKWVGLTTVGSFSLKHRVN